MGDGDQRWNCAWNSKGFPGKDWKQCQVVKESWQLKDGAEVITGADPRTWLIRKVDKGPNQEKEKQRTQLSTAVTQEYQSWNSVRVKEWLGPSHVYLQMTVRLCTLFWYVFGVGRQHGDYHKCLYFYFPSDRGHIVPCLSNPPNNKYSFHLRPFLRSFFWGFEIWKIENKLL